MSILKPCFKFCLLILLISCGTQKAFYSTSHTIIVDDEEDISLGSDDTATLEESYNAEPLEVIESLTPIAAATPKEYSGLQKRYARELGTSPNVIKNVGLYKFIEEWKGTPYLWGGMDKNGVDCSAFIQHLFKRVYSITIPRTSYTQFYHKWIEPYGSQEYLKEGDLVFFSTDSKKQITHVGVYLHNRKFVNSQSSVGVNITSLDNPYWKKYYVAAGRIRSKR